MFDSHYQQSMFNLIEPNLQQQLEYSLIGILKPSIQIDGNQWCVLYGENLQDGVAGYGNSPHLAVLDFNKSWYASLKTL